MLDDLKYIHEKDQGDALGIAERQGAQLKLEFDVSGLKVGEVLNVVWAGVGGSALPGQVIKSLLTLSVPFEIVRDYNLPSYVGEKTLVIVVSYSGNTEEAIEALAQAEARGAQIVVMASGGHLQELAAEKGHPFLAVPKADQPRYAVFAMLKAGVDTLGKAGVIQDQDITGQLVAAADFAGEALQTWRAEVPSAHNPAKQLAQELMGKSVVIYGGPKMFAAAYKWKISCNENAKQVAWCNQIPEFNHNEFIGWSEQPRQKPYAVVDLRSNLEHPRTQKRFPVSERLLSGMRPAPQVVEVQGDTLAKQLIWAITYGDFVTLYLALLNGLDPAPVDLVEKLKKVMAE